MRSWGCTPTGVLPMIVQILPTDPGAAGPNTSIRNVHSCILNRFSNRVHNWKNLFPLCLFVLCFSLDCFKWRILKNLAALFSSFTRSLRHVFFTPVSLKPWQLWFGLCLCESYTVRDLEGEAEVEESTLTKQGYADLLEVQRRFSLQANSS